ncbi:MAG: hypothetical protein GY757_43445 [bacterium]|nr:hypothetical protein [bacterium]
MKQIVIVSVLVLIIINLPVAAAKPGTLEDVFKPGMLEVSGNELYVVEGAKVSVFSLKDYSLLRTFGKEGEGPGELKIRTFLSMPTILSVFPGHIFVQGFDKFIFFSKEGKLIKEQKFNRLIKILPVKKNFVVKTFPFQGKDKKGYESIKLVDAQMKEIKELYRQECALDMEKMSSITMSPDSLNFYVYNDKIYIEESKKGFVVEVFDSEGKRLHRIDKKIEKTPVTKEYREIALGKVKEDLLQKRLNYFVPGDVIEAGWDAFKKWATFVYPDTLPPMQDIVVDKNTIYIQTFKRQKDKEEYILVDHKGNILKRVYLPALKTSTFANNMSGQGLRLYDIDNGRFIYLEENEDDEVWEVHVIKI